MTRFGAHRVLVVGLACMSAGLLLLSEIQADGSYLPIVLVVVPARRRRRRAGRRAADDRRAVGGPGRRRRHRLGDREPVDVRPGAIGLAVVGALAAGHTRTLSAGGEPLADALVGGYQLGYLVCAGAVAAGLLVAMSVLRPARVAT